MNDNSIVIKVMFNSEKNSIVINNNGVIINNNSIVINNNFYNNSIVINNNRVVFNNNGVVINNRLLPNERLMFCLLVESPSNKTFSEPHSNLPGGNYALETTHVFN